MYFLSIQVLASNAPFAEAPSPLSDLVNPAQALEPLDDAIQATEKTIPVPITTSPVKLLLDIRGEPGNRLLLPSDVSIHKDSVYIVDSGHHRIMVFNRQGGFKFSFGHKGKTPGSFNGPVGIDTDKNGEVIVADRNNRRIQIFDAKGRFIQGFPVIHEGNSIIPIDVVAHPENNLLYVTGNSNHRIMVFSRSGKLQNSWGGNGIERLKFRYPATIALTPAFDLAIVDILNSRIQVFEPDGAFLVTLGVWGVLPGQLVRPKGVVVDRMGRFYVSDSYMELVQVFDSESRFLHVLGHDGKPETMVTAAGIALDEDQRLYVAKMRENRVSVYSLEP